MKTVLRELAALCATLLSVGCASVTAPSSEVFSVDSTVLEKHGTLLPSPENPTRQLEGFATRSGKVLPFVGNELVIDAGDTVLLHQLEHDYGAVVISSPTPPRIPGLELKRALPPQTRLLLKIDPSRSTLSDLAASLQARGIKGPLRVSSIDAARTIGIAARFSGARVSLNTVFTPTGRFALTSTQENPTGAGTFLTTGSMPWMSDSATQPGSLNISVVRAWAYLLYKNLPPLNGTWTPPIVAILDGGFALDANGVPSNGNSDFYFLGPKPIQANLVEHTDSAGGSNPVSCTAGFPCPWHGTETFSVAMARPGNSFGIAGTGGFVAQPLLIRTDYSAYSVAEALRMVSLYDQVSVINMSFTTIEHAGTVSDLDFSALDNVQQALNLAASSGVVPVAAAGNSNENDGSKWDNVPCTMDWVICVGAIQPNLPAQSEGFSGSGDAVDIWAPDCIPTTVLPSTVGLPAAQQTPNECGTSIAAPFVSGVAALLKALDPTLTVNGVQSVLQATALPSADPKVSRGYVNALAAVMAVSPNLPPTISILSPANNTKVDWNNTANLIASVADPDQGAGIDDVQVRWISDIQGPLCAAINCDTPPLKLGHHTVTAIITDPFGATASASIGLDAVSVPPTAQILSPLPNSLYFSSQQIPLRAIASSPSEIIANGEFSWRDSAGLIASGPDASVMLGAGIHTIQLRVADSVGNTVNRSVVIKVVNGRGYPSAVITSPAANAFVAYQSSLTLVGAGTDPVEGVLPDADLEWSSDVDGVLGTGKTFTFTPTSGRCGVGHETITLTVKNSVGKVGTDQVKILAGNTC